MSGSMVIMVVCLTLWETAKMFSKWIVPFCTSSSSSKSYQDDLIFW